ncbi:DUF3868 domain-containing protein [uncultured Alistipes sp.]|uniref:DUF3868 domain-containing protein n=1 Tax=uncultured Alistipes sp. TaxID=538949 RepID=UPI0032B1F3AB
MKIRTLLALAASGLGLAANAQQTEDLRIVRSDGSLVVEMGIDLSGLEVESNRAVLLTPVMVNGADSLELSSVGIYGRRRYYYYLRNGAGMLSGPGEMSYTSSERPEKVAYCARFPYEAWMNGASLHLHRADYGCCNTLLDERSGLLGRYDEPVPLEPVLPTLAYLRPTAEQEKVYSLSGSAFIDFPVNQTVIYPDYRRNTVELAKIRATIDSVRSDGDIRITTVWLKGYASPESSYANNTRLAKGRTAALERHIMQLYHFEPGIVRTDFEPEDWAGLRRYVERSELAHRGEILAMIDGGDDPDIREARIRRTYPEEYRYLLRNCYPALRHTDYRIDYTIRRFTDVEEIKRVMKVQPQKLSLNEFYLAAQSLEPGSEEFDEVFETAVRMYPDDPTANLNAANTALQRGDLKAARRYLDKSGDAPETIYTRGVLALMSKDYGEAQLRMQEARSLGIALADDALVQIAKLKENETK